VRSVRPWSVDTDVWALGCVLFFPFSFRCESVPIVNVLALGLRGLRNDAVGLRESIPLAAVLVCVGLKTISMDCVLEVSSGLLCERGDSIGDLSTVLGSESCLSFIMGLGLLPCASSLSHCST